MLIKSNRLAILLIGSDLSDTITADSPLHKLFSDSAAPFSRRNKEHLQSVIFGTHKGSSSAGFIFGNE